MSKRAFLITNIKEYGKFISICIENDVCVFRTYWDDREKEDRCYCIDWEQRRCFYASRRYFEEKGYKIVTPIFQLDKYGKYKFSTSLF